MRKLLLIACLLLTAVGMRAAKTPQVLWSEDNRTLYFINSETDYHGKAFNGYTVTKLCSGTQVTATGTKNPGWNPYRKNVKNIVFDASFADVRPTSCYSWFYDMENLVSITGIEYLNTSQVTNMAYMFNNCSKLKTLDLTHFDVSNVTTMVRMFQNSSALTTIMSNDDWYSEKVISSTNMFGNCTSLVGAVAYSADNSNNILYANPFTGYFSGEIVPMVIYCEDNTTLYFTKSAKTLVPGKKYNGHTVTSLWKDTDVTDSGENARGLWSYQKNTTNVVIEPSFADVLPTSCAGWFVGLANLASITGLEYLNTSEVTTMSSMFSGCVELTSLDLKNFNTSKVKSMYAMFQRCDGLTSLDLTNFDTSEVTNMQYMFYGCSGLTSIDLTNVNTSKVTSMNSMFQNCQNLTSIDLTNFDTSKVTNMQYLFCGCSSLTSLDLTNFNMQNASLINSMFKECSALKTIYCDDDWKTNTINNSADLFLDCTSLVGAVAYDAKNKNDVTFANPTTGYFTTIHQVVWCDGNKTLYFISKAKTIAAGDTYNGQTVTAAWSDTEVTATGTTEPGWTAYSENVENVVFDATFVRAHPTSCAQWFTNMSHLTSITGLEYLNTSEVTTMNSMFGECRALTSLDVKTFDTQNVTDISRLFSGCAALENLDVSSFNTGNVTDMSGLFSGCAALKSIDVSSFNTENVTNMSDMFRNCAALESLDVKNFNTSNVTNTGSMFSGCAALKTLDLTKFDMKKVTEMASMFADCKNLTTIYCNDDWNTETVTSSDNMFTGCTNLVGAVAFNADNANDVTFANPETGYFFFTGERIPTVIFCQKSRTLYFINATKAYAIDDTYKGQTVTDVWNGTLVTETGAENPGWKIVNNLAESVIIDKSFADVRPTSCYGWFEQLGSKVTTITGLEYLNTSEVTNMARMFLKSSGLTSLDLRHFDTKNVTDMHWMFNECSSLKTLDVSKFNTSKVTNMYGMFAGCKPLTGLDLSSFDTQNVTDMAYMFADCEHLPSLDLSKFNTSKVTTMREMFRSCEGLTTLDVSSFDTQNVTDMFNMFYMCYNVEALDVSGFNTSNVTSMKQMFHGCLHMKSLDPSKFDTQNVTDMSNMFVSCAGLTSLDLTNWDTQKVTDMNNMFAGCTGLTSLDLSNWNVQNVTDFTEMFINCTKLQTIYCNYDWDTRKVANSGKMFDGCENLVGAEAYNAKNDNDVTFANPETGYFTFNGERIPSVIWCKDNGTLYFTNAIKTYAEGDTFKGQKVTDIWSGADVTASGTSAPNWVLKKDDISSIIIDKTFADVRPTSCRSWFERMKAPITGLEFLNTSEVTTMSHMFYLYKGMESLDLSTFDTRNVTDMNSMFASYNSLKSIDLSMFNTSKVTDMTTMFLKCDGLESLDLSAFDTRNVTSMSQMFMDCSNLKNLNLSKFNTSKVTNMGGMFMNCGSLESLDLSAFDTQNMTNMSSMFDGCSKLTSLDLSMFNTSKVTNMTTMFNDCFALTSLDVTGFDTQNVTSMRDMFQYCSSLTSLDLSNFNTSKVTDMYRMFNQCQSLTNLNVSGFDTKNVTDMHAMFGSCHNLTTIDLSNFNTSKVTDMGGLFYTCNSLTSLDLTSFDTRNVKNMNNMFLACSDLTTIYCNDDWNTGTVTSSEDMFASCTNLVGAVAYNVDNAKDVTFANPETGYFTFTGERIPNVIFCQSNRTLYFTNATKAYAIDDTYKGQKVTDVWTGTLVTETGAENPGWKIVSHLAESVIIDKSFADVRPTSCYGWFEQLGSMVTTITGLEYLNTSEVTNMARMFLKSSGLTSLDLRHFDTKNVTDMYWMFNECSSLKTLDVSKFNTSKVTNMYGMFAGCKPLTALDLSSFDTQNVTDMAYMFADCEHLPSLDLSKFNTSKVTNMREMFRSCEGLTTLDVSSFDTQNVTDMFNMFYMCYNVEALDVSGFNTSNVTSMKQMFHGCLHMKSLDPSKFDTQNVTDMSNMFVSCAGLTSLDLTNWDTQKVTDMNNMFAGCTGLTSLDLTNWNLQNVTDFTEMFINCTKLQTIYCNYDWDTRNVANSGKMFAGCEELVGAETYNAKNDNDVTFANPETGYFTFNGERIPNVIWCEGNRTLYFINATKAYAAGDTFKGQTVSGSWSGKLVTDTGADFPGWSYTRDLVYSVIIDENFYDVHPTSCQAWFDEMREVSEIKGLEHLNTSEVTNMRRMFLGCHGLKSLNLKFFNTSKVTDMAYMFYECYSLTSLDVSGFDTQNVTDMSGMFQGCTGLTSLDITNFDTSKVTNMSFMLSDLGGLSSLNLTKFSTASATEMYAMFEGCTSLATIFCDDDWSQGIVTSSTRMFNKCINLSGAVAYNSKNANDITLANPKGYFTTTIHIELKDGEDNSAILDEYNGKVVSVNYDRVLKAIDNGDGSWTSKAYTVCLPYDCNLMKEVRMGQILVCKLWYIKDNKEFLFSNTEPGIKAGIPYLIVVKEGEISLNAEKVVITNQVDEGEEVLEWDTLWPNVLGRWKGTYHRIYDEECESQNIYGMQSDGRWERYYVTKHGPKWCWIETFRGYFQADESTGNNTYKPVYKQYVQGDDEDDPIIDFPAGAFDGDNINDETTGIMHVIEANGEHHYFDLQGRPLNSKPAKGVYIDNGKKIIKK